MAKQNNKPHPIRVGRGIKANVWTNHGKNGAWNTVSFVRTYKDDDGEFQDSDSFTRDDLLYVAYAATKALDYIVAKAEESDADE